MKVTNNLNSYQFKGNYLDFFLFSLLMKLKKPCFVFNVSKVSADKAAVELTIGCITMKFKIKMLQGFDDNTS